MQIVGRVESLWRYPVKSLGGGRAEEVFLGFAGVYGDRIYAFAIDAAPAGFPFLTGRNRPEMLLYQAFYRYPDLAWLPPNLAVDVRTPSGDIRAIDDSALAAELRGNVAGEVRLIRSDHAQADCRPISLISLQTVAQIGAEVGAVLDQRRFRANINVDLADLAGFGEDAFVGRVLRIGTTAVVAVTGRDPRCKMITIDPETAQLSPEIMRRVKNLHDGMAGVYGAVLVEGIVRAGDAITLLEKGSLG
jgi:uncharacterized protein YcbX